MKHFRQLVQELPAKKVVFTIGRFQPPTTGHGLLVAAVKHVADKQGADHVIYASRSHDKKSNPLPVDRKVYYLKRMFPGTNFVAANENVRTFIEAIKELNKKYKNLVMIAGSDRVPEYKKLLDKYNGKEFNYDTIEVVSAGERDPDADNASGMSGTKMRDAAKKGDFNAFKKGLPSTLTTQDAKRLMNEIREGMGIESLKEQVVLERSDLREKYHAGEIYNIGDIVESADVVYQIKKRGSNHLLLQDQDGNLVNKWITDVTESTKEFNLQQGLLEMKFTSADKIKVARIIANTLGVADVEKKGSAEQLVNDGLRKVRNKPMRPEYIDVLHKMLATAKEAGIEYDEKLVPQKVVTEVSKHSFVGKVLRKNELKNKVDSSWKELGDAQKKGDHSQASKAFRKHERYANLERPGTWTKVKEEVTEGTKQPNGTDKVGDASQVNEISKDTLKSYIAKSMGSKSAADFTRGVKMAQGSGGEEELRKKSEKRSAGIHTAIKKLTKEELRQVNEMDYGHDDGPPYHGHGYPKGADKKGGKEINLGPDKIVSPKKFVKQSMGDLNALFQKSLDNKKVKKEEVELEEGKMGELHDTISRHLDKHISDFKSGHTGMDQFGSKVLAAHKSVAKAHGLEHKHAAKMVNDYVDSKLNEETINETQVEFRIDNRDKVKGDHKATFADHEAKVGDVTDKATYVTVPSHRAKSFKSAMKSKHGVNVELSEETELAEGKDYSVTVTHYADGKHTKHEYTVKNANDYKHAKHIAMQRHGKKIGTLKQGEQYGASNMDVKELNKESYSEISDLLEQIATAAMMNKDTTELKKKLSVARNDVKNNDSDVEADKQTEPVEKKIGHSITAPHESDAVRKMKIRQMSEEVEELDEDQATAEYKIKKFVGPDGKTHQRKVRPHKVTFSASKGNAEPEQDSPGENLKKEGFDPFFNDGTQTADSMQSTQTIADLKKKKPVKEEQESEDDHEELSDDELDDMANSVTDLEHVIDAYDDDEFDIVDDNGDKVEDEKEEVKEEVLNEVLSRMERLKARVRFAQTKAKRERRVQIALRTRSNTKTMNNRARKLAVKLMKQRIARKPLNKLSVSEKERIEKVIERRKAAVGRLAMKLVPRVRKIENERLSHKNYTK